MRYQVILGSRMTVVVTATSKLDAERKAVHLALDMGIDRDELLALSDDDVKVSRA